MANTEFGLVDAPNIGSGPGGSKYYTQLTIGKYKRPKPFDRAAFPKTIILILPLPNELRDDTSVSYTAPNLETIGDLANGNYGSMLGAIALRHSGNIINNVGAAGAGAIFGDVGEKIGSNLLNADQITSAVQQATGLAPNPNPSVAFQGPVLRDFSYTWAFYPKSRDESSKIQRMIKILKRSALPRNPISGSAAILDYPDMVQVNFFPWDAALGTGELTYKNQWGWTENSIIKYKKCFMQTVNVNYNAFGVPAFFEGSTLPASYQITINFREAEYMLSEDWDEGVGVGPIDSSGRVGFDVMGAITDAVATGILGPVAGPIVKSALDPVLDQLNAVGTALTVAANTP